MIQNVFGAWVWKLLPADVPELLGIDRILGHSKVQRPVFEDSKHTAADASSEPSLLLSPRKGSSLSLVLVTQLCLTLCDLMDCSPTCSSVHGISLAKILEWVGISFSRGSS